MTLPENLTRRLGRTHYFSNVDLPNAYNQIDPGPERQKHRGVLLPFGINSATGYFQDIMNRLTSNLTGRAVSMDNILISGTTAEEQNNTLQQLLKRLNDKGLRCYIEKCVLTEDSVTYPGHTIYRKAFLNVQKQMSSHSNVTQLHLFLGSEVFYNKSLSTISSPPYHQTEKNTRYTTLTDRKCKNSKSTHSLCPWLIIV